MKSQTSLDYVRNCMLLLVPIMLWNMLFSANLPRAFSPDVFWKDIPAFLAAGENFFRLVIFIVPLLMPLRIRTTEQKTGLALYIIGTTLYYLAWLALMIFPSSAWSLSAAGFLAPAYTPLIWLVGIGLMGSSLYFSSPYRSWMYISLSIIFISFHISHTLLVFSRTL